MCGIVGAVSTLDIVPILVQGLQRLEYRGYDSCGVAVYADGLKRARSTARVAELADQVDKERIAGGTGIAHTRWATHGGPTDLNAHPHLSDEGRLAVIHNGIIENFAELKQELLRKGVVFKSETDTEVAAALLGDIYRNQVHGGSAKGDLTKAMHDAANAANDHLGLPDADSKALERSMEDLAGPAGGLDLSTMGMGGAEGMAQDMGAGALGGLPELDLGEMEGMGLEMEMDMNMGGGGDDDWGLDFDNM